MPISEQTLTRLQKQCDDALDFSPWAVAGLLKEIRTLKEQPKEQPVEIPHINECREALNNLCAAYYNYGVSSARKDENTDHLVKAMDCKIKVAQIIGGLRSNTAPPMREMGNCRDCYGKGVIYEKIGECSSCYGTGSISAKIEGDKS